MVVMAKNSVKDIHLKLWNIQQSSEKPCSELQRRESTGSIRERAYSGREAGTGKGDRVTKKTKERGIQGPACGPLLELQL